MSRCVKEAEVIAWEELGPEAVRRLLVEDMPLIVATDVMGNDLCSTGPAHYSAEGKAMKH